MLIIIQPSKGKLDMTQFNTIITCLCCNRVERKNRLEEIKSYVPWLYLFAYRSATAFPLPPDHNGQLKLQLKTLPPFIARDITLVSESDVLMDTIHLTTTSIHCLYTNQRLDYRLLGAGNRQTRWRIWRISSYRLVT